MHAPVHSNMMTYRGMHYLQAKSLPLSFHTCIPEEFLVIGVNDSVLRVVETIATIVPALGDLCFWFTIG